MPLMVNTQQSASWHFTAKMFFFKRAGRGRPQPRGPAHGCIFAWVRLMALSASFSDLMTAIITLGGKKNGLFIGPRMAWTELAVFVLPLSLFRTRTYLGSSGWRGWGVSGACVHVRGRWTDVSLSFLRHHPWRSFGSFRSMYCLFGRNGRKQRW